MTARPYIGILVPDRASRLRILRAYGRQCYPETELFAFCPGDIDWERLRIAGLRYDRGGCQEYSYPFPDAVYNRIFNSRPDLVSRLEARMDGGVCFNRINFFSKWELYGWLKPTEAGALVPESRLCSAAAISEMLARYRLLYLKPCYGSRGNGVYRVEYGASGEVAIGEHHLAPRLVARSMEEGVDMLTRLLGSEPYLAQQGIRSSTTGGRYFDIRALVQKDGEGNWRLSSLVSRIAYENCFNTSVCEDVCDAAKLLARSFDAARSAALLRTLHAASIGAAAIVEAQTGLMGEMSVDFLLDPQQRLWMIELNGKPDKLLYNELEDDELMRRLYRRPMAYAHYLADLRLSRQTGGE